MKDEFEEADVMAQVMPPNGVVLPAKGEKVGVPGNVMELREQLVKKYHEGSSSLVEKIRKAGKDDIESLLVALIEEVVKETDHLLGNELVSANNGELRDASVISFKRAEVLEKAMRAVQAKQEFEREGGIDIDSLAMTVIYRFFMMKVKEAFERMGVGNEINDLFFRTFPGVMENWKRELRQRFEEMKK